MSGKRKRHNAQVKMSSSLSESNLEKRFQSASNTQDSIQTLSLWLLHHRAHHAKIVAAWMKVLQRAKITHRLTLFYLANDVVQNSKRKGILQFVNSFATVLKEATLLVRDDQIRHSIKRVFLIWEQRSIYTPEFIADLTAILGNSKVPSTAPSKLLANFKPEQIIKKLRELQKLDSDANKKKSLVNFNKLSATDAEILQQFKDRMHGQQFKSDFDENVKNLEGYLECMSNLLTARSELILLLEQGEIFYDQQRGEAKVVVHAYKTFGGKVKNVEKELAAVKLPSPVPSPTVDAPSPTNSELEVELNLPNDSEKPKELESVEDAPSPVGSPEGLNLSPEPKEEKKSQPATTKSVGNPIPTLSNFFGHEENGMTSWLGAFSSKNEPRKAPTKAETKTADPSSLDSRLSNLLQNIPNLPPGLQSSLLSSASSASNIPQSDPVSSPTVSKKDKPYDPTMGTGCLTPVKDECSGQNTPLQDEDTHSSHNIFSKLTSTKSQSSKDIFKGLTNLLQSASAAKEDSQSKDKFLSYSSGDFHEQQGGMTSFINSQASASFFSTSQSSVPLNTKTLAETLMSSVNSYQSAAFDGSSSMPLYPSQSSQGKESHSFIPSLVPSTSIDNFSFSSANFSTEEYNPEMQVFDTEMDLDQDMDVSNINIPSPEALSPPPASSTDKELPRAAPARRLSTLITVVPEGSPMGDPPTEKPSFPTEDVYKSDKENVTQMPPWNNIPPTLPDNIPLLADDPVKNSPTEEYFIGKNDANMPAFYTSGPPMPAVPPCENGKYGHPTPDPSLSRIETVQSHREDLNGRWFGNNRPGNNSPPVQYNRPPDPQFFNHNHNMQRPPNFVPRNNWSPRQRQDNSFNNHKRNHSFQNQQYGPRPSNRFPSRGRGWGRPRQY